MGDLDIHFVKHILGVVNHTASSAPGYGTQPLHRHQKQKESEGEKSAKKG